MFLYTEKVIYGVIVNGLLHGIFVDITVMINPLEIAVVRGDKFSEPLFLCVAFGYPAPTLTWSGISSLRDATQFPVSTV